MSYPQYNYMFFPKTVYKTIICNRSVLLVQLKELPLSYATNAF